MPSPATRRGATAALVMLGVADIAFALQQIAVIPALPTVESDLGASREWTAWLLTGYLAVASVSVPVLGKLADRHGKRRVLLWVLAIFLAGSTAAALAPSIAVLILARALQGVGGAVFPLTLAIARQELADEHVGSGIGLLTGAFGVGTALGFVYGGVATELLGWRWVFGGGAVAIALVLVVAPRLLPERGGGHQTRLDTPGAALLGGGLVALLVALTEGVSRGWGSAVVVGCFAASALLVALWILRDLHVEEPLLDLEVLARRPVLATNCATLLLGYVLFGIFFLIPQLVQLPTGFGLDAGPLATGLLLLPTAVGQLIAGPLSGPLARRYGARIPFGSGMALCTAGTAILAAWFDVGWLLVLGLFAVGFGFGVAIGVSSTVVTRTAPAGQTGVATALNSVVRRMGGGIGGQIGAALLAALPVAGAATPSATAFTVAFGVSAAVGAAGTGFALLVPGPAP